MKQTRSLGVVNARKNAKVHAVRTAQARWFSAMLVTMCSQEYILECVTLDPSEAGRLCKRCFARQPLPWEGTT